MVSGACFFFFKQKTAYEMRISDWSSDVCSSDLKLVRWRSEFARLHTWRRVSSKDCKLLHRISKEIDFGAEKRGVVQPQRDLTYVTGRRQFMCRTADAENMRRNPFREKGRAHHTGLAALEQNIRGREKKREERA